MNSFKLVKAAIFLSIQFAPVCGYLFKIYLGQNALADVTDVKLASNIDDCILFCLNKIGCKRANLQYGTCELLEGNIQLVETEDVTTLMRKF